MFHPVIAKYHPRKGAWLPCWTGSDAYSDRDEAIRTAERHRQASTILNNDDYIATSKPQTQKEKEGN